MKNKLPQLCVLLGLISCYILKFYWSLYTSVQNNVNFLLWDPMHPTFALIGFIKIFCICFLIWPTTATSTKLPKLCQQEEEELKCERKSDLGLVICKGGLQHHKDYWKAKVVFLCFWLESYINPEEILSTFPFVQKLTVRNGNIKDFKTDFPQSEFLQHLILANLNITTVRPSLFSYLENLKILDLSRNHLKQFSADIIKSSPSLIKIILTDNPWDCSLDLNWMLDKSVNSKISNKNHVKCGGNIFTGKPVYQVMSLIKKMNKTCPNDICSCTMNNIVWDTNQSYLIPVITVNCSGRGLTELPKKLPLNTTTLLLHGNNITDLLPLVHNKAYRSVADVYLDYNKVKSIDILEGAVWLKNFRVFSLKGNELTQLPIYALDNAFERNSKMAKVYLSQNPWKCSCLFIPEFQHLLIKYGSVVKDKNDIRCMELEDDKNSNQKIISLSTSSVCGKPDKTINSLDILSAVFASLILLIIGKLVYDYLVFKNTGKLPWIVTKMP